MPTAPLILYHAPQTCALATHLALDHSGLPHELRRLNFGAQQQRSADYLALNPKGRVPALVTPRGVLTETPALLLYLAQCAPEAGLAPLDDPFALAEWNAFNTYLCSTVHVAHAHRRRGARWSDDPAAWASMAAKVPQSMGDAMRPIEAGYLRGPWVMGERFSAADYYLLTIARWLDGDGVDLSQLPRVMAHRERLLAEPRVQRVIAESEAVARGD